MRKDGECREGWCNSSEEGWCNSGKTAVRRNAGRDGATAVRRDGATYNNSNRVLNNHVIVTRIEWGVQQKWDFRRAE